MKKTILVAVMALIVLSFSSCRKEIFKGPAYDFTAVAPTGQTLYYKIMDDGSVMVTNTGQWYGGCAEPPYPYPDHGPAGDLVIPDSVTHDSITYAVTRIGKSAFTECYNLGQVTLPSTVTAIEWYAFSGSGVTEINLPESLTSLGGKAFQFCYHLRSIAIPDGITIIREQTFDQCDALAEITIGNGVTFIGDMAFYECRNLRSLTLGSSLDTIDYYAFEGCSSLASVSFPPSLRAIKSGAFSACGSLTEVDIPNTVTHIGTYPFGGCSRLTAIRVDPSHPNYATEDGVLFNKAKTELIQCPGGKTGAYAIPGSVRTILYRSLWGCKGLSAVTIPESVTTIEVHAFLGCNGLSAIVVPNSVTTIEYAAFEDCKSLTSLTLGSHVSYCELMIIAGCTRLTTVTSLNTQPPQLEGALWGGPSYINPNNLTLIVPAGCAQRYRQSSWGDIFPNITEQ